MIIFKWERLNHQREIDEAVRELFLRALPKVHAVLGQKRAKFHMHPAFLYLIEYHLLLFYRAGDFFTMILIRKTYNIS